MFQLNLQYRWQILCVIYFLFSPFDRPNEDETDIDYVQAKHAGEFATDCTHLYRDCQPGDGLLDNISKFM